ncbi:MAG: hypothetical protein A3F91_08285 [Flavobacteria bacterium RIFCSPLOWO2_12_FULL_35_11]|nr:MAG: hypothetical protein A3F91_08285 [Flavobacteria bacterium RIFCSPLOWO2_12_FULL_35_11]
MSRTQVVYKKRIIETLEELPESKLKEVLDFIEFLRNKRKKNEDPILRVSGCLSGDSLSAKEIEEALYGEFQK